MPNKYEIAQAVQPEIVPIAPYSPLPWQIEPLKCTEPVMLLTGSAGGGKALALDTEVPTPTGFTTMGELKVGNFVLDHNGKPTEVIAATEVLQNRPCYKLNFKADTTVIADENHLWRVQLENDTDFTILSTKDIFEGFPKNSYIFQSVSTSINGIFIFREYQTLLDIKAVESVPVRCIQVAHKSGLFLVTRSQIVTHNSRIAAEKMHLYLKKYPGSMGLMVRKQRNSMVNSTVLFMERTIIGNDPTVQHFPSKNRFEYANGSILAYGGMDGEEQKQQIRSIGQAGSLHIAWMEEANAFQEDDFNELLARMRGTGVPWRQIILSTNPDSPTHWIYKRLILNQEATTYYSNAGLNTYNPADYTTTLDKLTGVAKLRLAEGRWVQASGVIYDEWDYDIHTCDPFIIPKTWTRVLSIDFGYINPFVCLFGALDEDNRLYIYKEWYKSKLTVNRHAIRINEELVNDVPPDVVICDHDSEDRQTLAEAGLSNIPAVKDVETGIGLVKDRLKVQDDGKPRLYVFRNSLLEVDPELETKNKPKRLIEEMPGYVWSTTTGTQNPKEVPLKLNDHACFVAGTQVLTQTGTVAIETIAPGTKVLTRSGWQKVIAAGKTAVNAKVMTIRLTDGRTLTGTPDHKIMAKDTFVKMCDLYVGDEILTLDVEDDVDPPTVAWIEHHLQWQSVYNLTVENVPEFYANGILVHNCDALRYMVMFCDHMDAGMDHA